MRGLLAIASGVLLTGCPAPSAVRVAGLTVDLITPADVDPLAGADTLVFRVLDADGAEISRSAGTIRDGVTAPLVTTFGVVEVEITARAGDEVLAAARTGPVVVGPEDELEVQALFLPVNQAVPLQWSPARDRIGHLSVLAPDGRALLLGGRAPSAGNVFADSEWWHPELGFDGDGPSLPEPVHGPASALLHDQRTFVAGGSASTGPSSQVLVIDPEAGTVTGIGALDAPIERPCVVSHPSLGALVFSEGATEVWSAEGRLGRDSSFVGDGVTGCASAGGYVVVAGQPNRGWGVFDLEGAVWPVRLIDTFTALVGVPDLQGPLVTRLDDDRVWVGAGWGVTASTATRIVNVRRGIASRKEDLAVARVYGQVAPWRQGTLVLGGGFYDFAQSDPVEALEIFDPEAGSLLVVPVPVARPTMSVLPGGAVLFTGGLTDGATPAGAVAVVPWLGESS